MSEYQAILEAQDGLCSICRKALSGISNPVDHDHVSGIIRGILCSYDNHRVVGRNRDWRVMQRVADYLREPPAVRVFGPRLVPGKSKRKRKPKPVSLS